MKPAPEKSATVPPAIKTFTDPARFVSAVLRLRPKLAVFDCDGTLWSDDSGEGFMNWGMEQGFFPSHVEQSLRARYAEYKAGRVAEEQMCGEMVTVHEGLATERLQRSAEQFFAERVAAGIFPEMLSLAYELRESGCELWVVSSTCDWVIRAGVQRFGIAPERVLAACVHAKKGLATGRLLRVPSGPDKAAAVREVIQRNPDVAFGNSIHDRELLACARHPFAVNPNPELRPVAQERGWPLYFPTTARWLRNADQRGEP